MDELLLNEQRIEGMAEGLRKLADLEDPIGEVIGMKNVPMGCSSDRRGFRWA